MAAASGLFNCIRTIFAAIGASAVTTIWERREAFHHVRLSGLIDPYNPVAGDVINALTSAGLSEQQALGYVARQITNQGFILGGAEIYKMCAFAFILLIGFTWLAKPAKKVG
jgi:DHA2 family multidrug resistance protein